MKKYLYSIVFATMILMSTTVVKATNEVYYTNNNNIEMTEKEYNNLLGLGFTYKQIDRMNYEEFINNKDIEGEILGESQKYIKTTTVVRNGINYTTSEEISKEEAMRLQSQNLPTRGPAGNYYDGMVLTNTYLITSKIVGISNTYMRLKADIEWLTIPTQRYNDVIGIGFEAAKVQIASTIVFREDWRNSDGTTGYNTVCSPKSMNTGGLVIYQLPTGSLQSLEATLYFNVKKKTGVGTITSLYASGNNAHATSNVSATNLFDYVVANYGGGVVVNSPYASYYSVGSPAYSSFVGTW